MLCLALLEHRTSVETVDLLSAQALTFESRSDHAACGKRPASFVRALINMEDVRDPARVCHLRRFNYCGLNFLGTHRDEQDMCAQYGSTPPWPIDDAGAAAPAVR
jgi:hypothetical protein